MWLPRSPQSRKSHVQIHKVLSSFFPDLYKLIYFSEKQTTSATHHPRPKNVLPTPWDVLHLTLSLSRPLLVHSSIHLHRRPSSAKFEDQPKYRSLAHISHRLVIFGNWIFEVVVNLIASKSIFLLLLTVEFSIYAYVADE